MSVELNTENHVKSPATGLPGDEFFDAEDGGELNFIISHTAGKFTNVHFGDLDIRALSPFGAAYRSTSGWDF